jgi:hypothetical protein
MKKTTDRLIVCGTDFSENSTEGVAAAAAMAGQFHKPLTLLHGSAIRVSPAYYRFFSPFAHNALQRVCGTPAFNSLAIHAIVIVVLRLSSPARSTLSACPFLSLRNSSNPTPRFFKNSRTIPRAFHRETGATPPPYRHQNSGPSRLERLNGK